ncbi:DUF4179 domain-containing protein [Paenibacillus sp. N1-5-1-14]|uniref:DUF4179 domain-containing protein n=1 Tax=Paenibacillus radicibacter TaxID=2972488 RepID=UPI002159542B|nr:DUF4179 domain-containing protein [Paenibacillus radicibacter]MCR8643307.1 DUF4179 domain-containing protein [Paenibacillus radicibacter]
MSKPNLNETMTKYIEEIEVPNELDQQIRQTFKQHHTQKENSKMTLKKKILAFSIAAALLIPTGAYAFNSSYFSQSNVNLNDLVNDQVKQAAANGLTVPIDHKISDQGITIHFKEMYVVDSKVLVHYRIEKADGTLVPYEFDTQGLNVRSDGKENGQQTTEPTYNVSGQEGFNALNFFGTAKSDNLPFYLTDSKGINLETGIADQGKPEGLLAFVTDGKKLPQEMVLHVNMNRIGGTKGNWQGELPINQQKATTPGTK